MADSASPTSPKPDQPAADLAARYAAISLPPAMAAIPEALEGMQFSQDFSGSAQQLQTDIDTLRLSLETLDLGRGLLSVNTDYVALHADTSMSLTGGLSSIPDAIHLTQQHTLSPDIDSHKPLANGAVHLQSAADHIAIIPEKLETRDEGPGTDDLSAFLSGN